MAFKNTKEPANMRSNTLVVPAALTRLEALQGLSVEQLAELGQLAHPYLIRRGDSGFQRISWQDGIALTAQKIRNRAGKDIAFIAGPHAGSDESLYVFSKWAHASQSPHVDAWGQESWRAAARAMYRTVGTADSSAIPEDMLMADIILLWGTSPSEWSDEMTKLIIGARARGAWVLLVHPVVSDQRRAWNKKRLQHPSIDTLVDAQISLRPGGIPALPTALLVEWIQRRREATSFIERHTLGWEAVKEQAQSLNVGALLDDAGVTSGSFQMLLQRLIGARHWISVLGSDFCTAPHGTDAAQALLNLHLAAGKIGHRGTGILNMSGTPTSASTARFGLDPERGPNGVNPTQPHSKKWADAWGFPVTLGEGWSALQSFRNAHRGGLNALVCMGSMDVPSQLETQEGEGPEFRLHLASHMDRAMLLPAETTLVLPVLPAGICPGTTSFSTAFRTIHFCTNKPFRAGDIRPLWRAVGSLAAATYPTLSGHLRFESADDIRAELARLFPSHKGVDKTPRPKWLQWPSSVSGGHFEGLADQKAHLHPISLTTPIRGRMKVAVHDMGHAVADKQQILLSEADGQRFGLAEQQVVTLETESGTVSAPIRFGPVRQGCVWTHNADLLDPRDLVDTPGWRIATLTSAGSAHDPQR